MEVEPVVLIGMGPEGIFGLSPASLAEIQSADEIWGAERLILTIPECKARKRVIGSDLSESLKELENRQAGKRIVILASGDPGFFGIEGSLLKILPAHEIRVFPAVSSLQVAFARIGVTWQDAALTSAHARPVSEVVGLARRFRKLGILTDPVQSPGWIAERLLSAGIPDCRAVVCENLGQTDESITDTRLDKLAGCNFSPLNVLLLIHDDGWREQPAFSARDDSAYRYVNGLITKRDVRIISIERLGIRASDVVWDIGAGSGAVSIECSELAWRGKVFAIEKDERCLDCINDNIYQFSAVNIDVIRGEAPQLLCGLPQPDAVFLGGSGSKLTEILDVVEVSARPGCRLAANFTLLENLLSGINWMREHGYTPEVTETRFAYSSATGSGTRLVPANPVYVLSVLLNTREVR